eukprot:Pgem_evm1s7276
MDTRQCDLIQTSWKLVAEGDAVEFVSWFYARCFELDPTCKLLFSGDMLEQGKLLIGMLNVVVKQIYHLDLIMDDIKSLGVKHKNYGVKKYMYFVMGRALLESFHCTLSDQFTNEMREAWLIAYPLLTNIMTRSAGNSVSVEFTRNMICPSNFSQEIFQFLLHKKSARKSFSKPIYKLIE